MRPSRGCWNSVLLVLFSAHHYRYSLAAPLRPLQTRLLQCLRRCPHPLRSLPSPSTLCLSVPAQRCLVRAPSLLFPLAADLPRSSTLLLFLPLFSRCPPCIRHHRLSAVQRILKVAIRQAQTKSRLVPFLISRPRRLCLLLARSSIALFVPLLS